MVKEMQIVKMHGAGNDFLVVDNRSGIIDDASALAIDICDRHFGIGADGLLIVSASDKADASMRIINSDGSEAEMCGNGIRCIGKYLYDNRLTDKANITIDTLSGLKTLSLHIGDDNMVHSVTVDMGQAIIKDLHLNLEVEGTNYDMCAVSTGNPHGVLFVDCLENIDVCKTGPQLETHPIWPDKANIEFAKVTSHNSIDQLTWERGVGETLACGTGAIATAVAAVARGLCSWPVTINLTGGVLIIDKNHIDGNILLTGPAATVFVTKISRAKLS